MREIILLVIFCVLAIVPSEQYTTRFDHVDWNAILKNDRLLKRHLDCLFDVPNTCNKEGEELKRIIPDALRTDCKYCTESQKNNAENAANYLIVNKPDWWKLIKERFDKDGSYEKKHQQELIKLKAKESYYLL